MLIGSFSGCHVVQGTSSDCHHLSPPFAHVMDLTIAWTRVHAIVAVLIASDVQVSCHASCTGKTVWEHSPPWRKERKIMRTNRGVNSPINCLYPLSYRTHTWRPTRAPTWPRGLPATWSRPVRLLRGPPGRCHVALVPRRNPGWSHAPRHLGLCATSAAATSPYR